MSESASEGMFGRGSSEVEPPQYCCAILEAPDGTLLMERRPPTAARAAKRLTCFGGGREDGEDPEACIRRELREELGWEVGDLERVVVLWRDGRVLAWFYRACAPARGVELRTEEGYEAVWVSPRELDVAGVSEWHVAAIRAFWAGVGTAVCST